ncbi:MAG: AAA family ATPase [Ruminococcaceae bacterium]|nr:AAA family ATPase [Oscillospiraceae bacterium]
MENKQYLESVYNVNYDSAMNYAKQGNLPATESALKRALEAIIKLMKMTYGREQEGYKSKADRIVELLKSIKQKIEEANKPKPATPGPANAKKAEAKEIEPREKIPVEQALARLNELVGLKEVKREVEQLIAELEINRDRLQCGLKDNATNHHMIFAGSPGTGKTTVARIMADILYSLGVVDKGQLVEVGREDLVAGYVGQTAIKTQEKIDEAMGGVLFIDEIYRLAEGGQTDFGKEAVGTILQAVENCRGEFITILAGYDSRMDEFLQMNPGLTSRFPTTLHFSDYTVDEMYEIFEGMCAKNQFAINPQMQIEVRKALGKMYDNRDPVHFGNARDVRNLFEKITKKQKMRLYNLKKQGQALSKEDYMMLVPQDMP